MTPNRADDGHGDRGRQKLGPTPSIQRTHLPAGARRIDTVFPEVGMVEKILPNDRRRVLEADPAGHQGRRHAAAVHAADGAY